jgi:ketosteroid isomerase-like protein
MRFEISETVHTPDREMVLRALEICSREVSSNVVRFGDRITLQGLGPSPRAKNPRDTTVFCVNAQNDLTIINGEVSFQASALLGDQPQSDVVRSKIEELFNQMKAQIDIDELNAVRAAVSLPPTTTTVSSAMSADASEEGFVAASVEHRESETRVAHSESGSADAISAAEFKSAIGSGQSAKSKDTVPPEQNVGAESSVEPERNAWLDDLFSQLKAQVDLEEKLATDAVATASIAAPTPATTGVTDYFANDISENASDVTVASDKRAEITNASSTELTELESFFSSKETTKQERTISTEQNAGMEQDAELKRHVEPEQNLDLKENAWLKELFNKMNARIDLEDQRIGQRAIAEASIDSSLPTTTNDMSSIVTEDVSAGEATSTDAPVREPEVMNSNVESNSENVAPIAESEVAAGSKQEAEDGRISELVQHAGVESSVELQPNLELEQSAKHTQSIEAQLTALQEESAKIVEEVKEEPSVDPGQSVWLQHVTELDLHARKPLEEQQFLVAGAVEEAPPKKRLAKRMTGLVVLLLVAAGIFTLYRARFNPEVPTVQTTIEQPAPIATDPLPATEPAHVADTKPLLPPTRSQVADPTIQAADIRVWLANWASAMRTRDASAQAAFYADTVDEYVGKYDVSKDAVLKDREATIHMRKGLWTVKMEKVVIERQTKSEAEVRLIKHFIDETAPSEIVESFVPTRLKLKRVAEGGWRITSEQDLPTSSPASPAR